MSDMAPQELSLSYKLTEDDIRAFTDHVLWKQFRIPLLLFVPVLVCVAFSAVVALLLVVFGSSDAQFTPQALLTLPLLIPICGGPFFSRWFARRKAVAMAKKNGALGGESFIRIDQDGVFARTPGFGEGTRFWKGVEDVRSIKNHILIFVTANMAYAIPKHAFPTAAAADQFLEAARRWHGAAKK